MSISSKKSQKKGEVEGKVRERNEVWEFIGGACACAFACGCACSCVCVSFFLVKHLLYHKHHEAYDGLWGHEPCLLESIHNRQAFIDGCHSWLGGKLVLLIVCTHTPTTWYWIVFRHMHCDEQNCHMFCTFAIACQANKSLLSKVLPYVDFNGY